MQALVQALSVIVNHMYIHRDNVAIIIICIINPRLYYAGDGCSALAVVL